MSCVVIVYINVLEKDLFSSHSLCFLHSCIFKGKALFVDAKARDPILPVFLLSHVIHVYRKLKVNMFSFFAKDHTCRLGGYPITVTTKLLHPPPQVVAKDRSFECKDKSILIDRL